MGVDNGTEKGTGFFLLQHRLMRSAPDEPAVHRRKYYLQQSSVPGADLRYGRTGLTASKIAEMLCVSKPAVTLKINELIRQGLVVKTPDPKDRRQNLLSINEEAVPNYKIYKKQDSLAVKKIAEMFSEEDIEKFCQMLNVLSDVNFSVLG